MLNIELNKPIYIEKYRASVIKNVVRGGVFEYCISWVERYPNDEYGYTMKKTKKTFTDEMLYDVLKNGNDPDDWAIRFSIEEANRMEEQKKSDKEIFFEKHKQNSEEYLKLCEKGFVVKTIPEEDGNCYVLGDDR